MQQCSSDFQRSLERRVGGLFAESTKFSQSMAPRTKTGTPQPNDLWRFFPAAPVESSQELKCLPDQSYSQSNFLEEVIKSDVVASSRVKEVMDMLELFETATASWTAESQEDFKGASRKWFSVPKARFLVHKTAEKTTPERVSMQLAKETLKEATKEELLQMIPVARVLSAAVYLSTASKAELLEKCPPKLNRMSADHMSLMRSPDSASLLRLPLGTSVKLLAYGEKCGVVAQHVVLKPPTELHVQKKHPHVTVSFAEKVLKRDIAAMKGNGTFDKWIFPLSLDGAVGIKLDNGKILFSDEEFYIETGVDIGAIRKRIVLDDNNTSSERTSLVTEEETETEATPAEEETRPSEEIRRLVAHSSFPSRRGENTSTHSVPPSPPAATSHQPQKSTSSSECRAATNGGTQTERNDCRVLHVSKTCQLFGEVRPASPSKSGPVDRMQDTKKKQSELRSECEVHRQAAWEEQKKGEEYLDMARAAYREGQRERGDQLNRVSVEATLRWKEHTTRAERLAFEASNLGRVNTHTIDLHNLHLQEAIARLKKVANGLVSFVQDVRTTYRLRIITGKGINSVDNVPVLRPAVIEYLKSSGLNAELDEHNEGVVIAYISPPDT